MERGSSRRIKGSMTSARLTSLFIIQLGVGLRHIQVSVACSTTLVIEAAAGNW
jgi:hypothetical protein